MNGLLNHRDCARVEEDFVLSLDAPEPTETWNPIPHRELIASVQHIFNKTGLVVDKKEYSVNPTGERMFGVWTLTNELMPGRFKSIGFRNSTDKSMSIGMCAGERVFVCDNLAFHGEYISLRKHTGGLDSVELDFIATGAYSMISDQFMDMMLDYNRLRDIELSDRKIIHLTNRVIENGIVNTQNLPGFLKLLDTKYYPDTAFSYFNAFTELVREEPLGKIADRTKALRTLLLKESF